MHYFISIIVILMTPIIIVICWTISYPYICFLRIKSYFVKRKQNKRLLHASMHGKVLELEHLIKAGVDVNIPILGGYGITPLKLAVIFGNTEIVKILLEAGADVNYVYEHGSTALHWAASKDHTEIIKHLLKAGADVKLTDENGETPLIRAENYGHTKTVDLLKKHGAKE